ncbi:hypothetical protein ACFE04_019756 [Oxalis oulophora]
MGATEHRHRVAGCPFLPFPPFKSMGATEQDGAQPSIQLAIQSLVPTLFLVYLLAYVPIRHKLASRSLSLRLRSNACDTICLQSTNKITPSAFYLLHSCTLQASWLSHSLPLIWSIVVDDAERGRFVSSCFHRFIRHIPPTASRNALRAEKAIVEKFKFGVTSHKPRLEWFPFMPSYLGMVSWTTSNIGGNFRVAAIALAPPGIISHHPENFATLNSFLSKLAFIGLVVGMRVIPAYQN